jgi:DNA-binding CsgD family transcriptional regulator
MYSGVVRAHAQNQGMITCAAGTHVADLASPITITYVLSLSDGLSMTDAASGGKGHSTCSARLGSNRQATVRSRAESLLGIARVDAIQGEEGRCHHHAGQALAVACGEERADVLIRQASIIGLLELGRGNAAAAADHFDRCAALASSLHPMDRAAAAFEADQVEALLALGREPEARGAAASQEAHAQLAGSPLALARAGRCRGLLKRSGQSEPEFEAALALHELASDDFERARTQLAYGERLRRERRCSAARDHLRTALDLFEQLGATPWSTRARNELQATSITRRGRGDPANADRLTPQELRVAEIIAGGATASQAAAQLFLSVKTIQAHLARAYAKLGVHNRAQLVTALARVKTAAGTPAGVGAN